MSQPQLIGAALMANVQVQPSISPMLDRPQFELYMTGVNLPNTDGDKNQTWISPPHHSIQNKKRTSFVFIYSTL